MPDPGTLALFVAAALPVVLVPGPSVAFIVSLSLRHGTRAGVLATAGVELGYLVHVAAAVVGLSALLAASSLAFSAVKLAGVAYLSWLAVSAWRSARRAGDELVAALDVVQAPARLTPLRHGLLVGALNPKTAVFFLAFLPQFADPAAGSVAAQVGLLGVLFILLACVPDLTWAIAAGRLRPRLARLRRRVVERASAAIYALLAGALLATSRSTS